MVPSPRPGSSGGAPALPAFAPLPRQRFRNRTFLSEAAAPHHANAVTKRRRYYGKDFSASYSRVRDSAAGRSGLLAGELAGNQPLPQRPTWPEPGLRQRGAARCPHSTVGASDGRPHRWYLGKVMRNPGSRAWLHLEIRSGHHLASYNADSSGPLMPSWSRYPAQERGPFLLWLCKQPQGYHV